MSFSLLDRCSGVGTAWIAEGFTNSKGGSLATSLDETIKLGNPDNATTPTNTGIIQHGRFGNRLSYDPARDEIIWTNGEMRFTPLSSSQTEIDAGLYRYRDWLADATIKAGNAAIGHYRLAAQTLDPVAADGGNGALSFPGGSFFQWVLSGAATGFSYDHTNGILYAAHGTRIAIQTRTNQEFDQDYGNPSFFTLFDEQDFVLGSKRWHVAWAGEELATIASRDKINQLMGSLAASMPWPIKPSGAKYMPSPIIMDDIAVMPFAFGAFGGVMLVNQRGSNGGTWIASHPIDQTALFGAFPVGIDRFMTVGLVGAGGILSLGDEDTKLVAITYRYNRTNTRLDIDDISVVPTDYKYTFPHHCGFMTFDTKRQALILMDPTFESFERHVFSILCHPLSPNKVNQPAPIEPIHAGQSTKWITAAYDDIMPIAAPFVRLDYGGSAVLSQTFTQADAGFRTDGTTGTGTFRCAFTSAACGTSFTVTALFSGWSTVQSFTNDKGEKYGADAVSLQSTSAAFLVSATLSATQPTFVNTTATILAKRPIKDNDAGGGTPRELDHPLSGSYPSPLVYDLNPQIWTGHIDQALTRPLYASTRTLEKTATVQYGKDLTDIEVRETWMGGGNRIAMSLSQFTCMYDYFNNAPDIQSDGFILWRPRDVSSKVYKVVMTGLTVGGSPNFVIDHLARQGDGWIHEPVELTLRIIEAVE